MKTLANKPAPGNAEITSWSTFGHHPLGVPEPGRCDMKWTRIMYMERKAGALTGDARIGRVTSNRTGRTLFYRNHVFRRIVGGGFKSNYYDEATGEDYWISGCKRRGGDRLYVSNVPLEIDEDVRVEYWRDIRGQPDRVNEKTA